MLITSFDIEYDFSAKKITSFGIWCSDGTRGNVDQERFREVLDRSDVILGHNIIQHDLPVMKKLMGYEPKRPLVLDTLYLSSILFAEKPYHKLTKDYITNESVDTQPNPTLDSRNTYTKLLPELIQKWNQLAEEFKSFYWHLLRDIPEFAGFFQIEHYDAALPFDKAIGILAENSICTSVDFKNIASAAPLEFAAAMAIIKVRDQDSILPVWLTYSHPGICPLITQLRSTDCGDPNCNYCRKNLSAKGALQKFFDFEDFRSFTDESPPLQQQIVEAGMSRKSFLAVLPTGGGKSLCYQIPALMAHEQRNGLTIVISPLQSLMKDQVDNLKRKDIGSAWTINGLVDSVTRSKAYQATEDGSASILYLSPESLRSGSIFKLLVKREIARFVIDEAHCFSSWGHDFRTDYLYIARFIKKIEKHQPWNNEIPVSCFTATAKPQVIHDITHYFKEKKEAELEIFITEAGRKNLSYQVTQTSSDEKFNRLNLLLDQCQGPTIIYVARVKTAEELTEQLTRQGRNALVYHGRLDMDTKQENQDLFMDDNSGYQIMVATSAFGMGVDKDNVTDVIHYEISGSLENYVQEAGRAGRDPNIHANCHILYDESDLQKHFALLNSTKLNKKDVDQIWRALKYFKREKFSRSTLEIAEQAGWDVKLHDLSTKVKTALSVLEEEGFIRRDENATRLYAKSILVKNFEKAREIIDPYVSGETDKKEALRIMQFLISREETQVDTISMALDIDRFKVSHWINKFKDWKILGDSTEVEGRVSHSTGSKGGRNKLAEAITIENALIEYFLREGKSSTIIHKKQLHSDLTGEDASSRTFHYLERILQTWGATSHVKLKAIYAQNNNHYHIQFKPELKNALQKIKTLQNTGSAILETLFSDCIIEVDDETRFSRFRLIFSELQKLLLNNHAIKATNAEIEEALFYLIRLGIIELDASLMIYYQPLNITRVADTKQRYTIEHHRSLENFYQHKTEQIHIIGEYAKKMLRSHLEALQFMDDYFKMDYEGFLIKYFKGKKNTLSQPISKSKFQTLFGDLSDEQLNVVKDKATNRILVSAGPGSGKTRVLVHKVASILTMEDVKPEQFLMLTFSRQAMEEMRIRTRKLIGDIAWYIDIHTFHSYAFKLEGRQGTLEHSDEIIRRATQSLQSDPALFPGVAMKQIIVVDEFQDIDDAQFQFLKAIVNLTTDARVVVVGDDDQNIYEFRGSSTRFMREFERHEESKTYFLTTNYRSKNNLVVFSNALASRIPGDRMKQDQIMTAHDQRPGTIVINRFPPKSKLLGTIAEEIGKSPRIHTISVLTKTNEEALRINHLLSEQSIPTNLIMERDGYQVRNIIEFYTLTKLLSKHAQQETGYLSASDILKCQSILKRDFQHSNLLKHALALFDRFLKLHESHYLADWKSYLRSLRHSDIHIDHNERVWISTMHKAKGKEFDIVYLPVEDSYPRKPEEFRLLYVALTRSKSEIHLFVNHDFFKSMLPPKSQHHSLPQPDQKDETMHILLGLTHVNLRNIKRPKAQKLMAEIFAGTKVALDNDRVTFGNSDLFKLSKKGMEKMNQIENKGLSLDSLVVDRVVMWKDTDSKHGRRYRVPILKANLSRLVLNGG